MPYLKQKKPILFITNMLIFINVLIIMASAFMMPLWSSFVTEIGGDLETAGLAICLFSMMVGLLMCLAGKIEHYYQNDEWFMWSSQLIVTLSYTGYLWVAHPWQLYLLQVALALGISFQTPVICAIYQRYFKQEQSALFWAVWNGFFYVATGLGALISATLVKHFNYKLMFFCLSILSTACLIITFYLMMHIKKVGFFELLSFPKAPLKKNELNPQ